MRLFLWKCKPRSLPFPVCTVGKGITRLVLQLGSVDIACRWLANWNLAFLEFRASCRPLSVSPLTSGSNTLAYVSTLSGSQPQVTGSLRAASLQSPGSVLPTFEEATESAHQQTSSASISSSVQTTFAGSQLSSLLILSDSWGPPLGFTVVFCDCNLGEGGSWYGYARSQRSGCLFTLQCSRTVGSFICVNPPSQGCTTLTEICSVSLDLGIRWGRPPLRRSSSFSDGFR